MTSRLTRCSPFTVCAVSLLVAVGCSSGTDPDARAGTSPAPSSPSTSGATEPSEPTADQSPPMGANGIEVAPDGSLWVASVQGDEVLQVDAATGRVLRRVIAPPGSGPDDVTVAGDGTVYWTGFVSGDVGRIPPAGPSTVIANVGVGANPVTLRDDGMLLVGRAGLGTGLFTIDPEAPTPVALADPGNVNAFAVATDGVLYAPSMNAATVIAVDAATGEPLRDVAALDGTPIALCHHDGNLFVLVLSDTAKVVRVDPADGTVELFTDTGLPTGDNLAAAPDGTIYVTGLTEPTVAVVDPDGTVARTMTIGS